MSLAEFEFACDGCSGLHFTSKSREPLTCPMGHTAFRRVYTFGAFHREMPGQFSQALGRYVGSKREYHDGLKAASEHASEQTGMDHNFLPMDMADRDATGVTDD